jgi:precorrin-3B methylase
MTGQLYGIGVGPGDPELLTLKALRLLRAAPVITGTGDWCQLRAGRRAMAQCRKTRDRDPLPDAPRPAARRSTTGGGASATVLDEGDDIAFLCRAIRCSMAASPASITSRAALPGNDRARRVVADRLRRRGGLLVQRDHPVGDPGHSCRAN